VRLLAGLLLIRLGASAMRWAVRRFNAMLSAKGYVRFSPKIDAALEHHWRARR